MLELHRQHGLNEAELVQAVNRCFPTAVSGALDTSLWEWLQATGQPVDIPLRQQPPGKYGVTASWTPSALGCRTGVAGVHKHAAAPMPLS